MQRVFFCAYIHNCYNLRPNDLRNDDDQILSYQLERVAIPNGGKSPLDTRAESTFFQPRVVTLRRYRNNGPSPPEEHNRAVVKLLNLSPRASRARSKNRGDLLFFAA